jgi:hypothetical protein
MDMAEVKSEWEREGERLFEATRRADEALAATPQGEAASKSDAEFANLLSQHSEARNRVHEARYASPEGQAKRAADAAFAGWLVEDGRRRTQRSQEQGQQPEPRTFSWGTHGGRWYILRAADEAVDLSPWIAKERVRPPETIPQPPGHWVLSPNDLHTTLAGLPEGTEVILTAGPNTLK